MEKTHTSSGHEVGSIAASRFLPYIFIFREEYNCECLAGRTSQFTSGNSDELFFIRYVVKFSALVPGGALYNEDQ